MIAVVLVKTKERPFLIRPIQLLRALVLLDIYQCREGFDHLGHLRGIFTEVVHKSNELQECFLISVQWKV